MNLFYYIETFSFLFQFIFGDFCNFHCAEEHIVCKREVIFEIGELQLLIHLLLRFFKI